MSKYNIEITETAGKDLYEIGRYIAKELLEPGIAKKLVEKISKEIFKLEELPLRNPLVNDERLAFLGIRKIMVDNYIVFYIVTEEHKTVTVVRILYTRRDWLNLM